RYGWQKAVENIDVGVADLSHESPDPRGEARHLKSTGLRGSLIVFHVNVRSKRRFVQKFIVNRGAEVHETQCVLAVPEPEWFVGGHDWSGSCPTAAESSACKVPMMSRMTLKTSGTTVYFSLRMGPRSRRVLMDGGFSDCPPRFP